MTVNGANNETNRRLQRLEEGQAETNRRLDRLEAGQEELRSGQAELRAGQEELRTGQKELRAGYEELRTGQKELRAGHEELRVGQKELRAGHEELRAGQKELRAGHEELRAGHEDLKQTVARIERNVETIRNDIGPLKAAHARDSALRVSYRICEDLGLEEVRVLDQAARRAMVRRADTSDIPRNHRYSFIEADAIIEATDSRDETHYVAMEASFTADERDTNRAVRNAAYLSRFTGQPAHAVVAAHRIDDRISPQVSSGAVRWCRLNERDLEID